MSRRLKARAPNTTEMCQLRQVLEENTSARLCRWAEALLFYGAGLDAQSVADALAVHVNTIYTCLHRFARMGISLLQRAERQVAPPRITAKQTDAIAQIAEQSPTEFGLPYGRWSLAKLRAFLIYQRHLLKAISHEHLRRLLEKAHLLTPSSAQTHQPRSSATRDFGSNSSCLAPFVAPWRDGLF